MAEIAIVIIAFGGRRHCMGQFGIVVAAAEVVVAAAEIVVAVRSAG